MKNFFVISFSLFFISVLSQDTIPQGIYYSIDDFLNKTPTEKDTLLIKKRTPRSIKFNGGNDYKVYSKDCRLELFDQFCVYSDGQNSYISCLYYNVQTHFAKMLTSGNYIVFEAGVSMDEKYYHD